MVIFVSLFEKGRRERVVAKSLLVLLALVAGLVIPDLKVVAAEATPFVLAQSSGPTIERGPPIQCEPNESKEWRQSEMCGRNDAAALIGGEYRCWSFYDSGSRSCKRTCTWTGKCQEP
jgi:hypothetical protein